MKTFLLSTIALGLIAVINSAEVDRAPIPFSVRALKPKPGWSCKESTGWSCKDCNTLQYCENGSFEFQITCGVQFPGRSYCNPDKGSCSSDRDVCQEIQTGMNCPSAGLFPDVEDCRKYISCSSKGASGISYNCLFNSNYIHSEKRCKTSAECYTVNEECEGQFKAISYKPDNRLYVICRGANSPLLKDCGRNLVFNETMMSCEFQCTNEGYFANPSNPASYYVCVYNGVELVRHEVQCVPGTIFNENTGNCVRDEDDETPV